MLVAIGWGEGGARISFAKGESMDLQDKPDSTPRRMAAAALSLESPFEACRKMRARKICPGYVYYSETGTEALFCSGHCSCRMRIRDATKARHAAALGRSGRTFTGTSVRILG